jgi:hypothetical protein
MVIAAMNRKAIPHLQHGLFFIARCIITRVSLICSPKMGANVNELMRMPSRGAIISACLL